MLAREMVAEVPDRALSGRSAGDDAAEAPAGVALHDDDRVVVEYWCVQVGTLAAPGTPLPVLAVAYLGRAARRLGDEVPGLAKSLSARAAADPADVDGRALDGYDAIRTYLHLWRRREAALGTLQMHHLSNDAYKLLTSRRVYTHHLDPALRWTVSHIYCLRQS
ncbi:hypothetical protein AB0E96_00315 [Kitasatospora sp. NPDC036755]|uniref:hypothetical protein n=1 Tax=Kitasatospora sp. NPDC036755 TaxID=3154600 RepID=UPI0033D815BD